MANTEGSGTLHQSHGTKTYRLRCDAIADRGPEREQKWLTGLRQVAILIDFVGEFWLLAPRRGIAPRNDFNDLAQSGSLNHLVRSREIVPGVTHLG